MAEINEASHIGMIDGGERVTYEGGALREPPTGKGRYDLITPFAIARILGTKGVESPCMVSDDPLDRAFWHMNEHRMGDRSVDHIAFAARCALDAIQSEADETDNLSWWFGIISPYALDRLAKWYELGAKKYANRNWEKGMSFCRLLDAAMRHPNRYRIGMRDEDHLAALAWNLFAYLHYEECGMDRFDDVPTYPEAHVSKLDVVCTADSLAAANPYHRDYQIIAVDFDGCLCKNAWPEIGEPNKALIGSLRNSRARGDKLILWTCREGERLAAAVEWCKSWGLEFDAVNANLPEMNEMYGNDSRKIGADLYLDDKAQKIEA